MPIQYNRPNWYSDSYERVLLLLKSQIPDAWNSLRPPNIEEVTRELDEDDSPIITGLANLSWDQAANIIDSSALFFLSGEHLRYYFPAIMLAATEIKDVGRSPAEEGLHTSNLLFFFREERRRPLIDVATSYRNYTYLQLQCIRTALDLVMIQRRETPQTTLSPFWLCIVPLESVDDDYLGEI